MFPENMVRYESAQASIAHTAYMKPTGKEPSVKCFRGLKQLKKAEHLRSGCELRLELLRDATPAPDAGTFCLRSGELLRLFYACVLYFWHA